MISNSANPVTDINSKLGEGSLWNPENKTLIWVDIESAMIHQFDEKTGRVKSWQCQDRITTIVPAQKDIYIIAGEKGIGFFNSATGRVLYKTNPEKHIATNRFNDGKCSPDGCFYAGTISEKKISGDASLYRYDHKEKTKPVLKGLTNSNGIIWSRDGKSVYHIDTPSQRVMKYDYNIAGGAFSNGRPVIEIPEPQGHPDGMCMDSRGRLWIALFYGAGVGCWNPETGEMEEWIEVPARRVTSCAFGGEELKTLYITTASHGADKAEKKDWPLSGRLFKAETDCSGLLQPRWTGPVPDLSETGIR